MGLVLHGLPAIDEDEHAMWGRPPDLQADALVGLVATTTELAQRDQGVPRRPGGLPHKGGSDFRGAPIRIASLLATSYNDVFSEDTWQASSHSDGADF